MLVGLEQGSWSELGVLLDLVRVVILAIPIRSSIVTGESGVIMMCIMMAVPPKAGSPPPWSFTKSKFPCFSI